MAEIFISYSRKDTPFVRRLHDTFVELKRETWVDWDGIPPSAEWLDEIFAAIDAADTFLFVVSPDSVASEMCGKEIAHAATNNKRIITILHRDVEPEACVRRWPTSSGSTLVTGMATAPRSRRSSRRSIPISTGSARIPACCCVPGNGNARPATAALSCAGRIFWKPSSGLVALSKPNRNPPFCTLNTSSPAGRPPQRFNGRP